METRPQTRRRRTSGPYNRDGGARSDGELVTDLQLEASSGVEDGDSWRVIRDDVHVYAVPVLTSMILKGTVWGFYHHLGGTSASDLRTPSRGIDRQDAYDLAADAVLGALPILRHQLITGRWDPTRRASIRTWFVSLAILRLPGPWRVWKRHRVARLPARLDQHPDSGDRPDAIIYSIEFEHHVELLDDDLLETIVRLDCAGLTDREISELIDRTVKSTEYQLSKARSRLRRRASYETWLDQQRGGIA
jgi:DNA-directed RNA polymerase specialized sigma24 family protein